MDGRPLCHLEEEDNGRTLCHMATACYHGEGVLEVAIVVVVVVKVMVEVKEVLEEGVTRNRGSSRRSTPITKEK